MTTFMGMYTKFGNAKLGKSVASVNRPAIDTCPGASETCKGICYALKNLYKALKIQDKYAASTINLPEKLPALVRIHASGDFDSTEYVQFWINTVKANTGTKFWGYTRSWQAKTGLLPSLEQLRAEPNVQLFASMDDSITESPPAGWRVAYISPDARFKGMKCLEQEGKMSDCKACGYCFKKTRGNVEFMPH